MLRKSLFFTLILSVLLASSGPCDAIVGVSLKLGGAFIPADSRPGGLIQVDIGPLSPFAELFKKSGITTVNSGVNFLLRAPSPVFTPYAGVGAGLSRASGGGASSSRALANLLVGADIKLPGTVSFFGQVKYIYTFGSATFRVREVALQGGLRFNFGI